MSRTQRIKALKKSLPWARIIGYNGHRDLRICSFDNHEHRCFEPCDVTIDGDAYCFQCADRIVRIHEKNASN